MFEPTENKVPLARNRDQPGGALRQRPGPARQHLRPAVVPGPRGEGRRTRDGGPGFRQRRARPCRRGRLRRTLADLTVLMERLDSVWNALAFDAPWKAAQEKDNARVALERFLQWHVMDRTGRTPVASEHDFDVTLKQATTRSVSAASWTVWRPTATAAPMSSTSRPASTRPPPRKWSATPSSPVYQLAVREGAVDEAFGGLRPEPGGAELVQLSPARPPPNGTAARPCPRCRRRNPLKGRRASGSATCWPRQPARCSTNSSRRARASTARTARSGHRAARGPRGATWSSDAGTEASRL
ncbi:DNA 3'-5' helicase OS=Streptomyces alboniger OX=132473 GN=CP975_23555 PE=3 SV=1 [Streptomyces alboniger]